MGGVRGWPRDLDWDDVLMLKSKGRGGGRLRSDEDRERDNGEGGPGCVVAKGDRGGGTGTGVSDVSKKDDVLDGAAVVVADAECDPTSTVCGTPAPMPVPNSETGRPLRSLFVRGNVLGPATCARGNDRGLGGGTSGAHDVLNRSLRDEDAESERGLVGNAVIVASNGGQTGVCVT